MCVGLGVRVTSGFPPPPPPRDGEAHSTRTEIADELKDKSRKSFYVHLFYLQDVSNTTIYDTNFMEPDWLFKILRVFIPEACAGEQG